MWNCQIGRLLWDEEGIIFLRTQYSPRSLYKSQLYDEPRKYWFSYKWTFVLLWLLWHMQNICSCISLHSFHKPSSVQWSKHRQIVGHTKSNKTTMIKIEIFNTQKSSTRICVGHVNRDRADITWQSKFAFYYIYPWHEN
jgi:hypothetical protein